MKCRIITITLGILCCLVEYTYTQRHNCGIDKFHCKSGQCIASELLCDGHADCKDESDETYLECSRREILCPEFAFRCIYGACIDGDKICNGVKDCNDNSDETLPKCANSGSNNATCATNQFRCNNGQCIASSNLCDGTTDCVDKSDESFLQCGSLTCPPLVFRCDYGACIDGDMACNGVINCADGSDEDPTRCNRTERPTSVRPLFPDITTHKPHTPPTPTPWTPRPRQQCIVPPQPQNGYWKLHKSQCQSGEHCNIEQGVVLDQGSYLVYGCNIGYELEGPANVFCTPEGRWLTIPACKEILCKPLHTASTFAECSYEDGPPFSCEYPVSPRTVATLKCRPAYREVRTPFSGHRSRVRCNKYGQWDPEPIQCIPECGIVSKNPKPLIVNGTQANIAEFPWHATLYRAESPDAPKEFICGATIIKENLLLTAAHCVYDENNKQLDDPSKFYIATGNVFRDYDDPFHDLRIVKKAKVKNIYITVDYLGLVGNYLSDIAILEITTPFTYTLLLVPACLDVSAYSDEVVFESGYGKIAGFGRTAVGESSYTLQTISVPYVPVNQCKSASALSGTQQFNTIDKFCAGYSNGTAACEGDSGGGLVFQSRGLWYLRGIVSVSLSTLQVGGSVTCDSHSYTLYTRISSHMQWIQDVILKLDMCKSYPCSKRN